MQGSIILARRFVIQGAFLGNCTRKAAYTCAGLLLLCLCGCSRLGLDQSFGANPLTGGRPAAGSRLLGISVPPGLEHYPEHGFEGSAMDGSMQGLEVFRGHISPPVAASTFFSSLKGQGWQLRQSLNKDSRALQLYENRDRLAAIVMRPQGAFTVVEIWVGPRLPDGAVLDFRQDFGGEASVVPEEYAPVEESSQPAEEIENFGPQEKDI